mmetsp:Transcript_11628/g.38450  ORF Transcript_11628/g.38450 Transcript_11628/m.38450 type:complete len:217 (-) Transcript_11628:592-1242(-)
MKARGIAEHQLRLAHGECLDEGRQIAEAQGPSRGHDGDGSGGRQRLGLEGCGAGRLSGLGRVQPARQEAVSEVADAATGRTDVQKRLPKVGAPVANQVGLVDEDEVEAGARAAGLEYRCLLCPLPVGAAPAQPLGRDHSGDQVALSLSRVENGALHGAYAQRRQVLATHERRSVRLIRDGVGLVKLFVSLPEARRDHAIHPELSQHACQLVQLCCD